MFIVVTYLPRSVSHLPYLLPKVPGVTSQLNLQLIYLPTELLAPMPLTQESTFGANPTKMMGVLIFQSRVGNSLRVQGGLLILLLLGNLGDFGQ